MVTSRQQRKPTDRLLRLSAIEMGETSALLTATRAAETKPAADPATGPATAAAPVSPAFEAFFQAEYTRLLRAMYLVCGNRHEAEELVQDAFVRAFEQWDRVSRADNMPGYLYRMALNLYRSKLRRVARAAKKVIQPPHEPDLFAAADDRDAIGRALAELPPGQREAVVMVEWMELTHQEVGALLGISPITVRVRIHRARGTLRPLLSDAGGEETQSDAPTGEDVPA